MRLDLFLKLTRIVKKREQAKELCKAGLIKVNGISAKPSKEISEGDVIEVDSAFKFVKLKVIRIPKTKNVSKKDASEYVEILETQKKDIR